MVNEDTCTEHFLPWIMKNLESGYVGERIRVVLLPPAGPELHEHLWDGMSAVVPYPPVLGRKLSGHAPES